MKGFLQDADLTYKYAVDSTSLSRKENLSTSLEKAENYTNKWTQVLNKDTTEHIKSQNKYFSPTRNLLREVVHWAYGLSEI